ncbi:helix-turn-helix domain-containing protein [Arthrobacter sp. NPDC057013]|uniref:helix-turn-helix domain-containing protein n=1 Tax=Arthrobacter sp. NPDC057013 TaxID=3345999 RepID=UPI0036259D48
MSHETRENYRTHVLLQLALFASLAEYEKELINERVRAGVIAAKSRGVKFGRQPPKPETVDTKVRLVRQLMGEGKTAEEAAEAVNWSRATLYRYLKEFGAEKGSIPEVTTRAARGRSSYAASKTTAARE